MARPAGATGLSRVRTFVRDAAIMLAIGMAGGQAFSLMGIPLAWTLGSMAAAAVVAATGARWQMPARIRDAARPVVGVLAGSMFTPGTMGAVLESWPAFLFVAFYTVLTTAIGWWFFRRICKRDPVTAFLASSPGGLSELTLLGGLLGGDMRSLALTHAIRIIVVISTVPAVIQYAIGAPLVRAVPAAAGATELWGWPILGACGLAGYAIGKAWRFPGGVMIAPMLLSAVVHALGLTQLSPPGWLVILVQVVVGSIAGGRFAGVRWHEFAEIVYQSAAWAVLLVVCTVATAALVSGFFDKPFPIFLMAIAPGGMTEMVVISYAMGLEAGFVVVSQIGRSFFVSGFMPLACSLLGLGNPAPASAGGGAKTEPAE